MTSFRAIAILIARLWAAAVLINTATYMASGVFSPSFWSMEAGAQFWVAHLLHGIWMLVGLVVWIAAPAVTRRIAPAPEAGQISVSISDQQLIAIGSFLIGGYYLVERAPRFIAQLIHLFIDAAKREPNAPIQVSSYMISSTLEQFAVLLVALFLTFRPYQIAAFFSSLRRAGLASEEKA